MIVRTKMRGLDSLTSRRVEFEVATESHYLLHNYGVNLVFQDESWKTPFDANIS